MAGNVLVRALAGLRQRRGQAFVEYIVLLVFVALAVAAAYSLFSDQIASVLTTLVRRIVDP